jgi:hypothetical protein
MCYRNIEGAVAKMASPNVPTSFGAEICGSLSAITDRISEWFSSRCFAAIGERGYGLGLGVS